MLRRLSDAPVQRKRQKGRQKIRWKDLCKRDRESVGLKGRIGHKKGKNDIRNHSGDPRWWEKPDIRNHSGNRRWWEKREEKKKMKESYPRGRIAPRVRRRCQSSVSPGRCHPSRSDVEADRGRDSFPSTPRRSTGQS